MCSFTSDSQILSPLIHIHHLLLPDIRQNSSTFSDVNLDGSTDEIEAPPAAGVLEDPDHDGVANEIPTSIVEFMEFYLLNYFKPATNEQSANVIAGRENNPDDVE